MNANETTADSQPQSGESQLAESRLAESRPYRIIVAYDGTSYQGWQTQENGPTVSAALSTTFKNVFGQDIKIIGASRTDAGVHALGQVARFDTALNLQPEAIKNAWNNRLPGDLHIRSLEPSLLDFNPRYDAVEKTYWYHFFTNRPMPFAARFGTFYYHDIDFDKLARCLAVFAGTHDFRSFCTGDDIKTTVRTISRIGLEYAPEFQAHRIAVVGPGFARYMVRRIVGACLHVACRPHVPIDELTRTMAQCNPLHTLPTAPARGLMLAHIVYKEQ